MLKKTLFLALFSLSLQTITYATDKDKDNEPPLTIRHTPQHSNLFHGFDWEPTESIPQSLEQAVRDSSPSPVTDLTPKPYPKKPNHSKNSTTPKHDYQHVNKRETTYNIHQPRANAQHSHTSKKKDK
jgi:hypothetical protein